MVLALVVLVVGVVGSCGVGGVGSVGRCVSVRSRVCCRGGDNIVAMIQGPGLFPFDINVRDDN